MKFRALILLGLAACGASSFASITIRFDNTGLGSSVDYVYNGNARSNFAGQMHFTDMTHSIGLTTFCVDLDHMIGGGSTYVADVVPTLGDAVVQLAGSVYANGQATVASNPDATALQIAIWSARYGGNLGANTGAFHLNSSWYSSHSSIITKAINFTTAGQLNLLDAIHYRPSPVDGGQAQLGPVPEPASLLALGVGLVGMFRKRLRKS